MQATVREFDPGTGSGSVFLDDGSVCPFGPDIFAASGLRLLRRGQRVAIRRGPSGAITALALATLPLPAEEARLPAEEARLPAEEAPPPAEEAPPPAEEAPPPAEEAPLPAEEAGA